MTLFLNSPKYIEAYQRVALTLFGMALAVLFSNLLIIFNKST
jgi:hypothetical protein